MSKKKKVVKKISSSMKDALSSISTSGDGSKVSFNIDIREILWNYPLFLSKLFTRFVPLSYILCFGLIGVLIVVAIQSNFFLNIVSGSTKKDTYVEGSVGAISSFNPLFTTNNHLDKSVQSLVFEKLVYLDKNGEPLPGIAKEWNVSSDYLTYDFVIKDGKYWHNKTKVIADDVVFTFQTAIKLAQDYDYDTIGSPIKEVDIKKINDDTVRFVLPEVNPTFFQLVSVYIVPMERLKDIDPREMLFDSFTKYPVGSGKYKVTRSDETSVYLKDNEYDEYSPSIKTLVFKVFPDTESLEMSFRIGALDGVGGWDRELFSFVDEYNNYTLHEEKEVNRRKLLFFNTRKESLKRKEMRQALNYLLDKEKFLKELGSGGYLINGAIPSESWAYNSNIETYQYNPTKASELLGGMEFKKNENSGYYEAKNGEILTFTISYFGNESNDRLVNLLVDLYKQEGIVLKIERLTYTSITQEIIATRDFEILLYEVETTIDPDQYNLWHSLKSNYPDLNLSGYDYERVDILLEDGRKTVNKNIRKERYSLFQKYLNTDAPVIFLYSPSYLYYVRNGWEGVDLSNMSYSYDRFNNIENWY